MPPKTPRKKSPPPRRHSSYYKSQIKRSPRSGYSFSDRAKRRRKSSYIRALLILFAFMFLVAGFILLGLFLKNFTNETTGTSEPDSRTDASGIYTDRTSENEGTSVPDPVYTQPSTEAPTEQAADVSENYGSYRGVYLDITKIKSLDELKAFIGSVKAKGYNAVNLDIKRPDGIIPISLENGRAKSIECIIPGDYQIKDAIALLHENGMYVSGTLSCFADGLATTTYPNDSLKSAATGLLWSDTDGGYWLSAFASGATSYMISLVTESAKTGFDEIILSNFYFPLVAKESEIIYNDGGKDKYNAVRDFVISARYAIDEVAPKVKLGIEIPLRYFMNVPNDITGVNPGMLTDVVNFITTSFAPAEIRDSYKINGEKFNNPTKNPHDSVEALCRHFDAYIKSIMFRPKLEAYNAPDGVVYDDKKIDAQKRALEEAEIGVFEMINYDNRY